MLGLLGAQPERNPLPPPQPALLLWSTLPTSFAGRMCRAAAEEPEAVLDEVHAVRQAVAADGGDAAHKVHPRDVAAERGRVVGRLWRGAAAWVTDEDD